MPTKQKRLIKINNKIKQSKCRIIAGHWRGRSIYFTQALALRPTTDRIRETVFNWMQPYLPNSQCLDAFAGSGALGFEAMSRGAKGLVFVENNLSTVKNLKKNCQQLDAKNVKIVADDFERWLKLEKKRASTAYNIVFLDPPFQLNMLNTSSQLLNDNKLLAKDAIIYVEHNKKQIPCLPENWQCIKNKQAGQVSYKLYQLREK